jgi:prepilin-type processing-associated H-X9-DG protein
MKVASDRKGTVPTEVEGFSRIELVVVAAVVALLAILLLPALSHAQENTTASVCLRNLGKLMTAFSQFAQDNEDRCVYENGANWAGGYWPNPGVIAGDSKAEAMEKVLAALAQGPLWRYESNYITYHCPGDPRANHRPPGNGWAWGSYSRVNTVGYSGNNAYGGWDSAVRRFQKTGEIGQPAMTTVFLEEADPRNENLGTWSMNTGLPGSSRGGTGWVDPLAFYHGNWSTFAFADGHAEGKTWTEASTIKANQDTTRGVLSFYWTGGVPSNPDYRWVHERYRYVNYWALL